MWVKYCILQKAMLVKYCILQNPIWSNIASCKTKPSHWDYWEFWPPESRRLVADAPPTDLFICWTWKWWFYSFIYLLSNWHEAHINMILAWSSFQKFPLSAELADFSGSCNEKMARRKISLPTDKTCFFPFYFFSFSLLLSKLLTFSLFSCSF